MRLYDTPWTAEEREAFEDGMRNHWGNLQLIHDEYVPTKTRAEIVRFYAQYKKCGLRQTVGVLY